MYLFSDILTRRGVLLPGARQNYIFPYYMLIFFFEKPPFLTLITSQLRVDSVIVF